MLNFIFPTFDATKAYAPVSVAYQSVDLYCSRYRQTKSQTC